MRTLSDALNTAQGKPVTRPGYLIYIAFNQPLRYSTQGDVEWPSGQVWQSANVMVSDLRVDAAQISGTLKIGNVDDVIGSLLLTYGISDRAIQIYGFDAGIGSVLGATDPVFLASGVGGEATVDVDAAQITVRSAKEYVYAPRQFVTPANGFTTVVPVGKTFRIGQTIYTVERN
jgi:hypothetical protein